ncbi:MAG: TauD/TfdA family dioxygenase [Cyanobacteria bacterium P01_B01_bin.77]
MVSVSFDNLVLQNGISDVTKSLIAHGYAVVKKCYERKDFLALAEMLGGVQGHARADEYGLVGDGSSVSESWKKAENEYIGTLDGELKPHTDGAYLNGLTWKNGSLRRVLPPALVAIQCVEQAESGGENVLIDLQQVTKSLLNDSPDVFKMLSKRGSVSFCRDDQIAVDLSIFDEVEKGRFYVRYNSDRFMYLPDWSREAVEYFNEHYIKNQNYRISIPLAYGEVLLIDNTRMLHSRNSFKLTANQTSRKIKRLWILNRNSDKLDCVEASHRSLDHFTAYLPVQKSISTSNSSKLFDFQKKLGIKLLGY